MIGKQLEVLWIDIELSRACINSDVSDLPLCIGLNIRYSTSRASLHGVGDRHLKKKRSSLKEIVVRLNEAFGEDVAPTDGARTINAIADTVSADDVSRTQIRNATNTREAIIADGRLESIIKAAALSLKNNDIGGLAAKILDDPQAIRPIAELIYDLVSKKKHLDIEEISDYTRNNNKETSDTSGRL